MINRKQSLLCLTFSKRSIYYRAGIICLTTCDFVLHGQAQFITFDYHKLVDQTAFLALLHTPLQLLFLQSLTFENSSPARSVSLSWNHTSFHFIFLFAFLSFESVTPLSSTHLLNQSSIPFSFSPTSFHVSNFPSLIAVVISWPFLHFALTCAHPLFFSWFSFPVYCSAFPVIFSMLYFVTFSPL